MESKSFSAAIIYTTYSALEPYPFVHTYHLLNGALQIEKKRGYKDIDIYTIGIHACMPLPQTKTASLNIHILGDDIMKGQIF